MPSIKRLRDTLARLCAESSGRIPKWLIPVIREQLATGGEIARSALVVDLVDNEQFALAYRSVLDSLRRRGARGTLEAAENQV